MRARICARDVGVRFYVDRHHQVVTPTVAHLRRAGKTKWGVRGVSFEVAPGEAVALLGPSGSGKTTLLRLIAGVYLCDTGSIDVDGRIASLLSVEAGLISLLTGRENAMLLGVLVGMTRSETRASIERIKEFSGLGDQFEDPVSSFSQGMRARLGFAVGQVANPEVLLLDEIHEALDHEFRDVVTRYALDLLERGGAVVAAGHDHPMLARFCSHALFIQSGGIRASGEFSEVQGTYLDGILESEPPALRVTGST
jgi:lipopolysaccharide transport system ATP-binding protein